MRLVVLGPLEGRVEDHLLFAARRDLVVERDERGPGGGRAYQFKHILIRDVAYESLPKEQRSRLHDTMGRWLEGAAGERLDEYAAIVAYHADQAYRLATELHDPGATDLGRRAWTYFSRRHAKPVAVTMCGPATNCAGAPARSPK